MDTKMYSNTTESNTGRTTTARSGPTPPIADTKEAQR